MYSGWIYKFKVNRPVTDDELQEALPREPQRNVEATDRGSLTRFNSTYVEFIDRCFSLRGSMGMLIVLAGFCFLFGASIFLFVNAFTDFAQGHWLLIISTAFFVFLLSLIPVLLALRKEFFTYTHYPIRYNRKTRKIYVFRHNGPGGVLVVPWDEGYFHRGHGMSDKSLLDVRCHVMEGNTVKDTFATGHSYGIEAPVNELWEFIRRYMDEGPKAVKPPFVSMTASPTWRNCWRMSFIRVGAASTLAQIILLPIEGPLVVLRWLVFKTCKKPVWPPEVEAECQIAENDPYRLPEPVNIGEGYETNKQALDAQVRKGQRERRMK
jgi:hypothetical protein